MRDVLSVETDLSTDELFDRILDTTLDEDEVRSALVALHGRPTQKVVECSLALCASAIPTERCIGLRVLRELDHTETDRDLRWEGIAPTVVHVVLTDGHPDVITWAISCLGYQAKGAEALAAVLTRMDHDDENVRFAVAAALPHLAGGPVPDPAAVEGLTRLTDDPDPEVRSYALMGLIGDLGLLDEIRPIVQGHLLDPDDQVRDYSRRALDGEQM